MPPEGWSCQLKAFLDFQPKWSHNQITSFPADPLKSLSRVIYFSESDEIGELAEPGNGLRKSVAFQRGE